MADRQNFQQSDAPNQAWSFNLPDLGGSEGSGSQRAGDRAGPDGALAESVRRLVDGSPVRSPAGSSDRARRNTADPMTIYDRILLDDFARRSEPPEPRGIPATALVLTAVLMLGVLGLMVSIVRPSGVSTPEAVDAAPVGIEVPFP